MGEMGKVGVNFSSSGLAGMSKLRLASRCTQVKGTAHGRLSRATEHSVPIGLGFGHSYSEERWATAMWSLQKLQCAVGEERSSNIPSSHSHPLHLHLFRTIQTRRYRRQRNTLPTDLHEPRQTVSYTFSYHTWSGL